MSLAPALALATFSIPRTTAALGTAFTALVPPKRGHKTKISFLQITSGGTAHTWYVLKELGRTTVVTAVAGGGTSVVLAADPGKYATVGRFAVTGITPSVADNGVAANDYLVFQLKDGTWTTAVVSAAATDGTTGRVTVTVGAIGSAGLAAGAKVWFMGVATNTDPNTGNAGTTLTPPTSATTPYPNAAGVGGATVADAVLTESPLLLYNANATAASVLDLGTAVYQRTGP